MCPKDTDIQNRSSKRQDLCLSGCDGCSETGDCEKGDVLGVARVAGIMAVKQTSHLIPMCHPLMIQKCSVDFEMDEENLEITAICTAKTEGQTGVEMEALTGVNVALLTIYDT